MKSFKTSDFLTSSDKTDFLGNGSYASVRRCFHKELENVVVKCVALTGSDETISSTKSNIEKEAQVLLRLEHKNIIQFHGVTCWNSCYGLVMEEATGHNLEDLFIHKTEIKNIPWLLRRRIFHDIAAGLDYLHNNFLGRSYIHGDLKLQNILLNEYLIAKIADFGAVSIAMASGAFSASLEIEQSKQFTVLYSPPELLKDPSLKRTCEMDVYSFGMIGYEIINRQRIFQGPSRTSIQMIAFLIESKGQKPDEKSFDETEKSLNYEIDLQVFQCLKNIVINCWKTNAKDRPTMKQVKNELKKFNDEEEFETEHLKKIRQSFSAKRIPLSEYGPQFQSVSTATSTSNGKNDIEFNVEISKSNMLTVFFCKYE